MGERVKTRGPAVGGTALGADDLAQTIAVFGLSLQTRGDDPQLRHDPRDKTIGAVGH